MEFARYSISFYRLAVKRSTLSASSFASRSTFYAQFHDGENRKLFAHSTKRSIFPRDRSEFKSAQIIQFLPAGDRALRRSIPTCKNGEGKMIPSRARPAETIAPKIPWRNNRTPIAINGSFPRFASNFRASFRMWALLGWFAAIKSSACGSTPEAEPGDPPESRWPSKYFMLFIFDSYVLRSNRDRRWQRLWFVL